MDKAHVKVQMGGAPAAVEVYRTAPTPNLIVLEFAAGDGAAAARPRSTQLAEFCDAGTKVDRRRPCQRRRALSRADPPRRQRIPGRADRHGRLHPRASPSSIVAPGAEPLGRIIAVVGAKGGVGASTIAHNLAWAISRGLRRPTVIADLDLAFGTAGLDFNQDPPQGIAEAVFAPDRLDDNFLDRLLSKCARAR